MKVRVPRFILLLFALALAGLCGDARATYAESAIFAFHTRDSNSTHYGESNSFAFNTRAIEGQRWAGFGWV